MERRDPVHQVLAELAELGPFQGLSLEEHRSLAEHLDEGCAECSALYAQGGAALDVLALAAPAAALAPERREALRAAIGPEGGVRTPPSRSGRREGWRFGFAALAAGIALAVAVGALVTALRVERAAESTLRLARAQLDARLADGDRRVEALDARLSSFESALETRGELQVRELPLGGTSGFVSVSARVVVDPAGHQVLLLASRLPPAPPGHTYQLWVIESGAPRSVGVFDPDAGGRVLQVEAAPPDLRDEFSVAVSVEPAGGVPQPTGPIVLASH